MNKYQRLLQETYVLTGEGKMDEFKTYLSDNVSWTEAADFCHLYEFDENDKVKKFIKIVDSAAVNKVFN